MIKNGMRPIHPSEILREDFLEPIGLSVHAIDSWVKGRHWIENQFSMLVIVKQFEWLLQG